MSELSPERRGGLVAHFHSGRPGWECSHTDTVRCCEDEADALAPLVAGWLAAEREAGAAEVRARVEALADDMERQSRICDVGNTATIAVRLRAALNGGE